MSKNAGAQAETNQMCHVHRTIYLNVCDWVRGEGIVKSGVIKSSSIIVSSTNVELAALQICKQTQQIHTLTHAYRMNFTLVSFLFFFFLFSVCAQLDFKPYIKCYIHQLAQFPPHQIYLVTSLHLVDAIMALSHFAVPIYLSCLVKHVRSSGDAEHANVEWE